MTPTAHDLTLAMTWWDWLEDEIIRQFPTATKEEIYALTSEAMKRLLRQAKED